MPELPGHERREERRARRQGRRLVRDGDEYTIDEENTITLEIPEHFEEASVEIQGEPWGWTKPGLRPRGWREDGQYGPRGHDDPGPYDGSWERS